jgi:fimbrial chaperone protein
MPIRSTSPSRTDGIVRHFGNFARKGGRVRTVTLIGMLALATPAAASTFQVNPVVVEITPGRHTAVLSVSNSETVPVSIRIKLLRWTQQDGADVYDDTDALIASPPIFTVPGAGRQLVRIGSRAQQLSGAYRIILEEVLSPQVRKGEVRIALRLNLPLYVTQTDQAKAVLRWSAWRDAANDVFVQAENSGDRYEAIVAIGTIDAAGKDAVLTSRLGAVLPGSTRRWNVGKHPELGSAAPLQLTARSSSGSVTQAQVMLGQR